MGGKKRLNKMILCLPYDLEQIYSFWCARYENISLEEFLNIRLSEFNMKINSIPESEPLHNIIKSRVINIGKIKDKEERKYWREQRKINKIPDIYLSSQELDEQLKKGIRKNLGGNNGKRFN